MLKTTALAMLAAATLLPAAAGAQAYYGERQPPPYGYGGDYGRGDDDGYARRGFTGYPEFRGFESHIADEIREAVRDDMIEPDDASDLFARLRDIRVQEAREFQVHGWRLPDDDRERLRDELARLDRMVDQIRNEP